MEGIARRQRLAGDPLHQLALDLLVHGPEEVLLAGEVVVERPAGHVGGAHDLLGSHAGESPRGEQRPGGRDQGGAGGLGLFGLAASDRLRHRSGLPPRGGPPSPFGPGSFRLDIHTVCMLVINTYCLYVNCRGECWQTNPPESPALSNP